MYQKSWQCYCNTGLLHYINLFLVYKDRSIRMQTTAAPISPPPKSTCKEKRNMKAVLRFTSNSVCRVNLMVILKLTLSEKVFNAVERLLGNPEQLFSH